MQMLKSTLLILCLPILLYAKEELVGYRVIRASPEDFLSAIRMPMQSQRQLERNSPSAGRLSQFISVKEKIVTSDRVQFKLNLDFPILKEYVEKHTSAKITLFFPHNQKNKYAIDGEFVTSSNDKILFHLLVQRHPVGSLVEFKVKESTYSDVTLKVFKKALRTSKLAAADPKTAEENSQKQEN